MNKDTVVQWWCPDCKDFFNINEPCNCPDHESSGKSKKRISDDIPIKKKKTKRGG